MASSLTLPFLNIPVEIRLKIYSFLPPKGHFLPHRSWRNISLTCRKTRQEFLPFMIEIKYHFKSLQRFVSWTDPLTHVSFISSIWTSFCSVPVTKRLSMSLDGMLNYPLEEKLLLEMISSVLSNITSFALISRITSVDFLEQFQNLRYLYFSGLATSVQPAKTLAMLRSMKSLDTIVLKAYPYHGFAISKLRQKHLCFTPEVLSKINPLTTFKIFDYHHLSRDSSLYFNIPTICALCVHLPTLRALTVYVHYKITEREVLQELLELISESQIRDLYLYLVVKTELAPIEYQWLLPTASMDYKSFCRRDMWERCFWTRKVLKVRRI